METLRERRRRLAGARQRAELRAESGKTIVLKIAEAIRIPLALADFDLNASIAFDWKPDLRHAPGLVIANVEKRRIAEILACVSRKLGVPSGRIGLHETPWLGFATVQRLALGQLVDLADAIEDSVLLEIDSPAGVILVDWYSVPGDEPFSLVVQGDQLVQAVASCFVMGHGSVLKHPAPPTTAPPSYR